MCQWDCGEPTSHLTRNLGEVTIYTYDSSNRFTSVASAITSILNNLGKTVTHERDSEYRLVAETDGAGDTTSYRHNAAGLKDRVTDARNNSWDQAV